MTKNKTISLGALFGLLALAAIVIIPNVSAMDMSGMGSMQDMQNTMQAQAASQVTHPTLPICTQVTPSVFGTSMVKTYTIPTGFTGDPSTANGQCIVDTTSYSIQNACTITNGIATAGHCEMFSTSWKVDATGPPNLPTEEWFKLGGLTLHPGEYLDLADTTPFMTTKGHMATILPCDDLGQPRVRVYEGILDGGVNTLEPANIQYLQHISDPGRGICAYHFDIGNTTNNPDGASDFVMMNDGKNSVTFTDRNTSTFSVLEGYLNGMG
ncbi:hypothetical protein [Candidatus Nitrosotalea bavarica]|uniref:hypothetical protein n=1 Tax=Candidatus Nitrosotalea bavarica TaxID=1903277 RepID=UPI000C70A2E3|nr:hypothetical protein [Candidatus Nitrosotalea bavarica]